MASWPGCEWIFRVRPGGRNLQQCRYPNSSSILRPSPSITTGTVRMASEPHGRRGRDCPDGRTSASYPWPTGIRCLAVHQRTCSGSGEARREDPRAAIQRIDLQTGVIGQNQATRCRQTGIRFQPGVPEVGLPVFRREKRLRWSGYDFIVFRQQTAKFLELVGVAGSQKQCFSQAWVPPGKRKTDRWQAIISRMPFSPRRRSVSRDSLEKGVSSAVP